MGGPTELLARTSSWAKTSLSERSVSSVIVEGGGDKIAALEAWSRAREGDVTAVVARGMEAKLAPLWETAADVEAVAPACVELANDYCRALEAAGHGADAVRLRVSISDGARPRCPKVHCDNVLLRCLVAVQGPATVVVTPSLSDETVSPALGDALLLKGRLWKQSRPARHRSPDFVEGRRILVTLDRLEDVVG